MSRMSHNEKESWGQKPFQCPRWAQCTDPGARSSNATVARTCGAVLGSRAPRPHSVPPEDKIPRVTNQRPRLQGDGWELFCTLLKRSHCLCLQPGNDLCIQRDISKCLTSRSAGEQKPKSVALTNFHCVNIPTMVDSKPCVESYNCSVHNWDEVGTPTCNFPALRADWHSICVIAFPGASGYMVFCFDSEMHRSRLRITVVYTHNCIYEEKTKINNSHFQVQWHNMKMLFL